MKKLINDDLGQSESDSGFNNETESDTDNDESNEKILKSILILTKAQQCALIIHYQAFISASLSKQNKYMDLILHD